MKKLILICLMPIFISAQEQKKAHSLEWKSDLIYESNNLDFSFLESILYTGYINNKIKNRWINSGDENNIIHLEISNGLSYNFDYKRQSFGIGIEDRNIIDARFMDDLLRISLEGNFKYQGDTLSFNNTKIRAERFQQYKFNYQLYFNNLEIHTGISYLAGNHSLSYIMDKGSLYTSPFGNFLDVNYNINALITDTSNLSLFANNGNGLALEIATSFKIKEYDISLSITDLGFIMWKPSSIIFDSDSNFNFKGIEIEDIFSFNDSILETINFINNINLINKSYKSYIPSIIHLSVSGKSGNEYLKTFTAGIITRWQPYYDNKKLSFSKIQQGFIESNFNPLYYIRTKVNLKKMEVIPILTYGGYLQEINIGLEITKGKKHTFTLGSKHIEDLITESKFRKASIYLKIKLHF